MIAAFALALALIPSLLLLWYFHSRDLHPEPGRVVWATFGLGVLSVLPVLLVALPVSHLLERGVSSPLARGPLDALLCAALPEELFKWVVVVAYCSRHKAFDEPMDGVVYGVVASLGFATFENVVYVVGEGPSMAVLRGLTAVPGHAAMGAVMGYFVGQWRLGPEAGRAAARWRSYAWPVLLHWLYDIGPLTLSAVAKGGGEGASSSGYLALLALLTVGVLVGEWIWALRLVRRLRWQQLAAPPFPSLVVDGGGAAAGLAPSPSAPAPPSPSPSVGAAEAPALPPAPFAAPPHAPPPSPTATAGGAPAGRGAGWLMTLSGGLLVSGGGFVLLALAMALLIGDGATHSVGDALVGGAIIGGLPVALGVLLFSRGLRRLVPPVRRRSA